MKNRTSSALTANAPVGVLDVYQNAAAAFSLRQLTKAYTGSAIRIRRNDDNVEVDVPFNGFAGLGSIGLENFLKSYCGGFGTNYFLGSETFDPLFWVYNNTSRVASAGTSPISSSNASKLLETNVTNKFNVTFPIGSSGGGARLSTSYYVKAAERNFAYVALQEDTSPFATAMVVVNLTTLQTQTNHTLPNNEFSNISFFAQSVGNGWVRISISANVNTLNTVVSSVGIATSLTTITYAGSSTSGILIWGGQAEAGETSIYDWKGNSSSASAFVTTWYDQSGNARNAAQANAALQPRIVDSGTVEKINGIPSVRFNAQFLDTATNIPAPSGGLATMFSVLPSVTGSYVGISLFSTLPDNEYVRYFADGLSYPLLGRTARTGQVSAGMPASGGLVFSHINNGANHLLYRNRVLGATAALGGSVNTALCKCRIGANFVSNGNYISENIIFPIVLSLQEKITIENNMMSFYGIN